MVILIGNNAGLNKVEAAYNTGQTVMPQDIFMRNVKSDKFQQFLDMYIMKYVSGKCPRCNSDDIVTITRNVHSIFWGCNKCKFGHWEKYLPPKQRATFIDGTTLKHQGLIYMNHDIETQPKPEPKVNKQKKPELTLNLFG